MLVNKSPEIFPVPDVGASWMPGLACLAHERTVEPDAATVGETAV